MNFISTFLGVLSIAALVLLLIYIIVFAINYKETPVTEEVRDHLEDEREFFHDLGIVMYWANVAVDESELDPPAREELIEAIDTIDDFIIEDRIEII